MSLKFKRHYKLVVMLTLLSAVLIVGMGDQPIVAYTAQPSEQVVAQGTHYSGELALFDAQVTHTIQVLFSGTSYQ